MPARGRGVCTVSRERTRVLVADEDAAVRAALAELLAPDGHDVVEVRTGVALARALEAACAAEAPFGVLITEARLPDVSAFEVLRSAHRSGIRPHTVILTTDATQHVYYEAYKHQCMCVLHKPLDLAEIRRLVRLLAENVHRA